jgi:hypothetical protein
MHEHREYFDVHEANALIPTLEFYFSELARIQKEVNELAAKAKRLGVELSIEERPEPTGHPIRDALQERCVGLAGEYSDIVDEIQDLGVIVEDPDLGTVNFFSWVDGEEVILSWQFGEPEIGHWFKVTEDFMARRPLGPQSQSTRLQPPLH